MISQHHKSVLWAEQFHDLTKRIEVLVDVKGVNCKTLHVFSQAAWDNHKSFNKENNGCKYVMKNKNQRLRNQENKIIENFTIIKMKAQTVT